MLVLNGGGLFGYQGQLFAAGPGAAFFMNSGERHDRGQPPGSPDADHLWTMVMEGSTLSFLLRVRKGRWSTAGPVRCQLSSAETGFDASAFLRQSSTGAQLPGEWRRAQCRAALEAIVAKVVEAGYLQPDENSPSAEFQRSVIEAVQHHIRQTAGRGIGLEDMARMAGYSKFHFLRLFRAYAGETPWAYLNRCRRDKVRRMREEGHRHKAIADALGFSCPTAFSRWYRQQRQNHPTA